MPTLRFGIALLALVAGTASCSVIIDTKKEQCSTDTDCANLGDAFADSTCQAGVCVKPDALGAMGCPAVEASKSAVVTLSFSVSFAGAIPKDPQPFTVVGCKRLDAMCASPVAGPVMADNGKTVELQVPTGFEGFLQVTNRDPMTDKDVTVPSMVFFGQKAQQDTAFWDLTIPTPGDVTLLGIGTNTDVDNEKLGSLVMIARDCDRTPLKGVVASNSTGGVEYYFDAMLPDKSLMATTEEGAAGFVNVPVGSSVMGGTLDNRPLSPTSVESRAGWFTYAEVFP